MDWHEGVRVWGWEGTEEERREKLGLGTQSIVVFVLSFLKSFRRIG